MLVPIATYVLKFAVPLFAAGCEMGPILLQPASASDTAPRAMSTPGFTFMMVSLTA
jgi:hypothetical protein